MYRSVNRLCCCITTRLLEHNAAISTTHPHETGTLPNTARHPTLIAFCPHFYVHQTISTATIQRDFRTSSHGACLKRLHTSCSCSCSPCCSPRNNSRQPHVLYMFLLLAPMRPSSLYPPLSTLAKQLLMDSRRSSTKSGQLEHSFKIPAGRACSSGALEDNSRQVPADLEYHRRAQPTNAALRRSAPSCAPRSQTWERRRLH